MVKFKNGDIITAKESSNNVYRFTCKRNNILAEVIDYNKFTRFIDILILDSIENRLIGGTYRVDSEYFCLTKDNQATVKKLRGLTKL